MGYFKDWWKSLFSGSGETDELGFPVLKLEDIPPKREKDISEPVYSFIKSFKGQRKRFKLTKNKTENFKPSWSITDKFTGVEYSACGPFEPTQGCNFVYIGGYQTLDYVVGRNTTWMTRDELEFVWKEVKDFELERYEKIFCKKNIRVRERLSKLYKGE